MMRAISIRAKETALRWRRGSRRSAFCWLAGLLLLVAGCRQIIPPSEQFGLVKGVNSFRSLNGLALFEKMLEAQGSKCLFPQKLSPKLETMDAIVLVGDTFSPPGKSARGWLEEWLGRSPDRTVIYFGRDFNADIFYRRETLSQLEPDKQALGRTRLAQKEALEFNAKLEKFSESTFCRWFYIETSGMSVDYVAFEGPWAAEIGNTTGVWPVSIRLLPPESKQRKQKPSWLAGTTANAGNGNQFKTSPDVLEGERSFEISEWTPSELDTDAAWNDQFKDLPRSEILLQGEDGQPLAFRLTDRKRFPDSQVIILTNGAPMLNGSIVQPLHQGIAKQLVASCANAKRVAFLRYGESGITISKAPEKEPLGGLEFLMVWPISAVTMPSALLCIIACAVLWPILGRPREAPSRSVSDFGLHIEALGKILHDSRDLAYAKEVVSQYFRRVRDETPPAWLDAYGGPQEESPASPDRKGIDLSGKSVDEIFKFDDQPGSPPKEAADPSTASKVTPVTPESGASGASGKDGSDERASP